MVGVFTPEADRLVFLLDLDRTLLIQSSDQEKTTEQSTPTQTETTAVRKDKPGPDSATGPGGQE